MSEVRIGGRKVGIRKKTNGKVTDPMGKKERKYTIRDGTEKRPNRMNTKKEPNHKEGKRQKNLIQ